MMRSPALKQDSIVGQNCSNAQQRGSPAIAQPHPEQPYFRFGLAGKVEKIFILADDYALVIGRIPADLGVGGSGQADVQNMLAIIATLLQVVRKCNRKLVVNQKRHDVWSTT